VSAWLTPTEEVPDPTDCEVVEVNVVRVLLVPHSNHAVVEAPFGLTPPFNVAPFIATPLAEVVETVGGTVPVVKLRIPSLCVPALFCAATRK
jgi:hypothetical protein